MSDIIAINSDGLSSPSLKLSLENKPRINHSLGWGFGWYPNDNQAAIVAKDAVAKNTEVLMNALTDWSSFRSTIFLCKARGGAKGYTQHEAQPFSRSFAGRDWLFIHNGDLDKTALSKLHTNTSGFLEPMGKTDSELAFCFLLGNTQQAGYRTLSSIDPERLLSWFKQLDQLGDADMIITDGLSVVSFHGTQSINKLSYTRVHPPTESIVLNSEVATLALNDPRDNYRTSLMFSSIQFDEGNWVEMHPGQMILAKRGAVVWSNDTTFTQLIGLQPSPPTLSENKIASSQKTPVNHEHQSVTVPRCITHTPDGTPLNYRVFDVTHTTEYRYTGIVEHSTHKFRLQPVNDHIQEIITSTLTISVEGEEIQYEDVFGNQAVHYSIDTPYSNLIITSKNKIKIFASPPDDHSFSRRQTSIPLTWMPWQRQMMMPYLLPLELPESQIEELTTYAMSFVERNDYHLLDTVKDMNLTLYQDFEYVQGSTSLSTTPFEVYTSRKGVCQDFTNLFICMARLLGIPARYRAGYIYTGADYSNKIQSEASHAWVELYLPYIGWRGFDPTNGCTAMQNHIRVTCGRNFRDAAPTSGTIFKGGGDETLTASVKIEEAK